MKSPAHASRKQSVDDFLLAANAGCMLVLVLAIGLPFVGIGGLFIYLGCDKIRNQGEVHDMAIIVPATVVSSNVRQSSTNMDSASKAYWADIEFRYEYGGRIWDSDKVWLVQEGGSAAEAQAVVDRYPEDARVSAFVDPEDPNTAYLEKRWSEMPYVAMSIGCLPMVFVAGLGIVAAGWKRPGVALLCGLSVGAAVILLLAITSGHYLRHVPTGERHWWMYLVFVGASAITLGLTATVLKARKLNRIYRHALDTPHLDG